MKNIINFNDVDIIVNQKKILSEVNFSLNKGDFIFLKGKVGCGKTSLLRTIYADLKCIGDKADVLNFNLLKIKETEIPFLRRQIGYVFQDFKFLYDKNIYENLEFVLQATGWKDEKEISKRIEYVLAEVEMTQKINAKPFELSGGEQQRISVARAMLNNPQIILADEPTGNLDEQNSIYITQKLFKMTENNTAVIFVTHNYNLIDLTKNSKIWEIENSYLKVIE